MPGVWPGEVKERRCGNRFCSVDFQESHDFAAILGTEQKWTPVRMPFFHLPMSGLRVTPGNDTPSVVAQAATLTKVAKAPREEVSAWPLQSPRLDMPGLLAGRSTGWFPTGWNRGRSRGCRVRREHCNNKSGEE